MADETAASNKAAVAPLPIVGEPAPASPELNLPRFKPTLVVFLRQCGDPFAEKTFRDLAALSENRRELTCIAVSQAGRDVTDRWVGEIGGSWEVEVVSDPERRLYALWGLGLNTSWQMFNPRALYATYALGRDEGIWSRGWSGRPRAAVPAPPPAPSAADDVPSNSTARGNKWQMGGAFAVDVAGAVRWVHVPQTSDDIIDFNPALALFGIAPLPPPKKAKRQASPPPAPIADGQHTLYQQPTQR